MKLVKTFFLICISIISLVIIADFLFLSEEVKEPIKSIKAKHQSYFNAAGNSHVSYSIETNSRSFVVTKEFSENVEKNQIITYQLSSIFKEVNSYSHSTQKTETHSLKWFSGFILPLLTLLVLFVVIKLKKRLDIFLFVICLLSLLNLTYLIVK